MKVLIADDELKVCRLIQHLVDWDVLGLEIIGIANDGRAALEMVHEKMPDIVITDIRMPVYDGLELIRRSKEVKSDINFIVISGYSQFEYAQQAIKYGVKDYLLKPLKKRELEQALEQIREIHESNLNVSRIKDEAEFAKEGVKAHILEKFFQKLLQENSSEFTDMDMSLEQMNNQCGCNFSEKYFVALRARAFFREELAPKQKEFLMNKLQQILREKVEMCHYTFASTIYRDEIVFIINTDQNNLHDFQKKLKYIKIGLSNFRETFGEIHVLLGQGRCCSSFDKIRVSLSEAEQAIMNRMGRDNEGYIEYSIQSKSGKKYTDIFDSNLRTELLNYQERMDLDGIQKQVDKLRELLFPYRYDGELVYGVFLELVETLRFGMKYYSAGSSFSVFEDYKNHYRTILNYNQLFEYIKEDIEKTYKIYLKNIQEAESRPIRDAKKYIHDNFDQHISLEKVSEYIGFNAAYFSTLFKKETGRNFLEYVTEIRIQKAKNYLTQTDQDIAEVGIAVGYNDLKYFSKLFKKVTGLNPSEFRKLYS